MKITNRQLTVLAVIVAALVVSIIMAAGASTAKPTAFDTCKSNLTVSMATGQGSLSAAYRDSKACMAISAALRAQAAQEVIKAP